MRPQREARPARSVRTPAPTGRRPAGAWTAQPARDRAERAAHLEVRSEAAGSDEFTVMTRPGKGPDVATGPGTGFPRHLRTYGAAFDYVLNPTRPIVGTVRDKATGQPLAGVQVAVWGPTYIDAFTDRDGDPYVISGNVQPFLRALHLQLALAPKPPAQRADLLLTLIDHLKRTNPNFLT